MVNHTLTTRPFSRHRRPVDTVALGTAALLLLTGCGTEPKAKEADVASIGTPSPTAPIGASAGASDTQRPQLRLDSSKEEVARLWNAWSACLEQKGFHNFQDVIKDGWRVPVESDPALPAARAQCESKAPLGPPELDRNRNPRYADDWREWIACMHRRDYKVIPLPDQDGYNVPDGPIPPNSLQIENECRMEAFGAKKK
ncbi:hypothetical protein ACFXKW_36695 [Streptomyces sp. NPDC059193]|uniref:hypothetical protein n=1 Tax=Streptomyces sp. NPDC059193 TaxID=3346763 RepID=UPI00368DA36E